MLGVSSCCWFLQHVCRSVDLTPLRGKTRVWSCEWFVCQYNLVHFINLLDRLNTMFNMRTTSDIRHVSNRVNEFGPKIYGYVSLIMIAPRQASRIYLRRPSVGPQGCDKSKSFVIIFNDLPFRLAHNIWCTAPQHFSRSVLSRVSAPWPQAMDECPMDVTLPDDDAGLSIANLQGIPAAWLCYSCIHASNFELLKV